MEGCPLRPRSPLALVARAATVLALRAGRRRACDAVRATSSCARRARTRRRTRTTSRCAATWRRWRSTPPREDAWLGLGALRLRLGEPGEAERVFDAALQRVPRLGRAIAAGRTPAGRWASTREAEADLDAYATPKATPRRSRELAGVVRRPTARSPAQLATWRRLLAHGGRRGRRAAEQRGPPDGARAASSWSARRRRSRVARAASAGRTTLDGAREGRATRGGEVASVQRSL